MKILLAIDDSKFSEEATKTVIAQAQPQGTEVRVLHVTDSNPLFITGEMGAQIPDVSALQKAQLMRANALVERAAKELRAAGFKVTTAVEEGDPKTKIIDQAAEWHADLIIVGSHGRKGLDRFLLGSVSEAVARHARCSVEIVRNPSGR